MDEYEAALRHSVPDPVCPLLAEIHSTLIYNLRTVFSNRHAAISSLKELDTRKLVLGVSFSTLHDAIMEIGNNWERAPLRHAEGRDGWEESLVGCLKDVRREASSARGDNLTDTCTRIARHISQLP